MATPSDSGDEGTVQLDAALHRFTHDPLAPASARALPMTEPLRQPAIWAVLRSAAEGALHHHREEEEEGREEEEEEGSAFLHHHRERIQVLQMGCGCMDGPSAPETLELLFAASTPLALTVLDYNEASLRVATSCTVYPLPSPPSFKKLAPGMAASSDVEVAFSWLDATRRTALHDVWQHTRAGASGVRLLTKGRAAFERDCGHVVTGVEDSFLTYDYGVGRWDVIVSFNSLFYALNDPDVDEGALFCRVLAGLAPGGVFVTDRTTAQLAAPGVVGTPGGAFGEDFVVSTIGKGVSAAYVFTRAR